MAYFPRRHPTSGVVLLKVLNMIYRVNDWSKFQHYKDRSPPWIKLHKSLLDDIKYQSLPIASRALAPMLWLLASENMEGTIDCEARVLAFRLRCSEKEIKEGLIPLIQQGFLINASAMLADCHHVAVPETETETETDILSDKSDGVRLANGKQKYKEDAIQVLEFLNMKTGKHYRPLKANLDLIAARLAEGAQVSDCRAVIARQSRKWMGTDSEIYLRPATLFNATKFAQYTGEIGND
jgi:uncharacterized phage protein (TIGR02220 family)